MDTLAHILIAGLALAACTDPNSTAPPALCPADRSELEPSEAQCPFPRRCESSAECPRGTACVACPGDGTCAEIAAESACDAVEFAEGDGVCLLPPSGRVGLVDGFEVSEFTLRRQISETVLAGGEPTEADRAAVYEFTALPETRYVHCALFGCPPEVVSTGDEQYEIANYDRCVLADKVFGSAVGFFDLTRADYVYPQDEQGRVCPERPLPTTLQVGCWAYGFTEVSGATLLVPVGVDDEIFDYTAGLEAIEAGSKTCTMAPCRGADLTIGGACKSACQPRCISGLDCPLEYEGNCRHEVSTCGRCAPSYSYVGVCQPPSE